MTMKRFTPWIVFGLMGISILASLMYGSPAASSMAKAVLSGFIGTLALLAVGGIIFFWRRIRGNKPTVDGAEKAKVAATAPSHTLGDAFFDAITYPFTWIWWALMFLVVWSYSPNLLVEPNWVWVPLFLWMLFVLFARARVYSKEKNGGKEKKASHGLTRSTTIVYRLAFLSTLGVIAYYAVVAPAGTWVKLTGRVSAGDLHAPNNLVVPKGVPLNPNFTSEQLGRNWDVTYIAANPQYRAPQAAWGGKKVVLLAEPGREITEVVNLTVNFTPEQASLDIHLSGSCQAVLNDRKPGVSKTCVGWWKDKGSQISGQFYLEVKEGGTSRYIDAYLYDGNYLPREKNLAMLLFSGPPIPSIMLQFRPKDWSREKG